ncbi:hypothetical protein [Kibdelosporangium philippinense]|nr:hypothetical protein [Kibdelosporangium philippinense]
MLREQLNGGVENAAPPLDTALLRLSLYPCDAEKLIGLPGALS